MEGCTLGREVQIDASGRRANEPASHTAEQALASAIFQTEILDRALRKPDAQGDRSAQAELVSLRQILERELDTLRGYINQLRPSLGAAGELDEALRDSAMAVSQRSGLPIDVIWR